MKAIFKNDYNAPPFRYELGSALLGASALLLVLLVLLVVIALVLRLLVYETNSNATVLGGGNIICGGDSMGEAIEHAAEEAFMHSTIGGGDNAGHETENLQYYEDEPHCDRCGTRGNEERNNDRCDEHSTQAEDRVQWEDKQTWEELESDPKAYDSYKKACRAALRRPGFDWSKVLEQVEPLLKEDREYVGLLNLSRKVPGLLEVVHLEPGPKASKTAKKGDELVYAAIPANIVKRVTKRPALFLFHTHPASPSTWPLPSSLDLAASIYLGSMHRYAAEAVISRYGATVYGLSEQGLESISKANDPRLATINLKHDVVAAHEAIRSWKPYRLADYEQFYDRHQLYYLSVPSRQMLADSQRAWQWKLDRQTVDHGLISQMASHSKDFRGSQ